MEHKVSAWTEQPEGSARVYRASCRCGWGATEKSIGALTGAIAVHLMEIEGR